MAVIDKIDNTHDAITAVCLTDSGLQVSLLTQIDLSFVVACLSISIRGISIFKMKSVISVLNIYDAVIQTLHTNDSNISEIAITKNVTKQ